jgi:hypothetical protein
VAIQTPFSLLGPYFENGGIRVAMDVNEQLIEQVRLLLWGELAYFFRKPLDAFVHG